jgi:hypothetical protein
LYDTSLPEITALILKLPSRNVRHLLGDEAEVPVALRPVVIALSQCEFRHEVIS